MSASTPTTTAIAAMIDHAVLGPALTRAEVDARLDTAVAHRVFSVCVRPSDVVHAVARLAGSGIAVGTVIAFPHGTTSTVAKVAEARQAVAEGAAELDVVLDVGRLRSGLTGEVEADVGAVVEAAPGRVVKVILETALLSEDDIVAGCRAAERAGAAFVKTSTGFAGGGATAGHVALMRRTVGPAVQVKASGGIRDLDTLLALHSAGATRFGTSATAAILDGVTSGGSADPVPARPDRSSY